MLQHFRVRCLVFLLFGLGAFADPALTFKKRGEVVKGYALEELLQVIPEVEISVFEPHDKAEETFKGFPVQELFTKVYGASWKNEEEVLFSCVDGYQPSIPMSHVEKYPAYLV